jgi:predicted enzyme related to lactoylglutathione lyase
MSTMSSTTVTNIGVTMFAVSDVDRAIAYYTGKLGWELRSDQRFGENDEGRWVEVAPPGSTARVALNPPMDGEPGGSAIGVETPDVDGEYERLKGAGVTIANEPMSPPGAPKMFSISDPDGNFIWVVEVPPAG